MANAIKKQISIKSSISIEQIDQIFQNLKIRTKNFKRPASELIIERYGRDPFLVLISTVLSLRTRDAVSLAASCRLFERARTPQAIINLGEAVIEQLIFPVGFYRRKANQIVNICHILFSDYANIVPSNLDQLLQLPGVGLKTANLTLAQGFLIPAMCVDTHVHRISHHLGLVNTKTPEQTESALRMLIPTYHWIALNSLFVMWGQNVCKSNIIPCMPCATLLICPKKTIFPTRL